MDSMEWYWRLRLGLPPRSEDREALRRMAPELFEPNRSDALQTDAESPRLLRYPAVFRYEVRNWLRMDGARPLVSVRQGSCPQHDCPLRLGGSSGQALGGQPEAKDGSLVLELMTVAGGWKSKASAFRDIAQKVHGGKGPIKDLLLTDPFIYLDKSEEEVIGGINSFLEYLDCFDIAGPEITIHQPPYAKGKKVVLGPIWRRSVSEHLKRRGYHVRFTYFRTVSEMRFHDRFYVARHADGLISGLFGPSMNGLNDKSFVLIGELEEMTLKRLRAQLVGWS